MSTPIANEEFIRRCIETHGSDYDYGKTVYLGGKKKVTIKHIECGTESQVLADNHRRGARCPACFGKPKWTTSKFIEEATKIHGNDYDYSNSVYTGALTPLQIGCNNCGYVFHSSPLNHIHAKSGCGKCWYLSTRDSWESILKRFKSLHGDRYCYDKFEYVNSSLKSTIKCNNCNTEFQQTSHAHTSSRKINHGGCPNECYGKKRVTQEEFVHRSLETHELDKYSYHETAYVHSLEPVKIWCNTCNMFFEQQAYAHMTGSNCRRCIIAKTKSNSELAWLDGLGIVQRQVHIPGTKFHADGFHNNTIYEFYGDYWHGNPRIYSSDYYNHRSKDTMGNLYTRTLTRHNKLLSIGYDVRFVWESDYDKGLLFSTEL